MNATVSSTGKSQKFLAAVTRELAGRYYYDAFLSYNFGDGDTIQRWRERLEGAHLRVYVDKPEAGAHFTARSASWFDHSSSNDSESSSTSR